MSNPETVCEMAKSEKRHDSYFHELNVAATLVEHRYDQIWDDEPQALLAWLAESRKDCELLVAAIQRMNGHDAEEILHNVAMQMAMQYVEQGR